MRLLFLFSALFASLIALTPLATLPARADAKLARCFTTDDGYYDCHIKMTNKDGSFEISAPKKPRYGLIVDEPGVAFAFVMRSTGRNVALPGKFKRNKQDLACWYNAETRVRICAW